MPRKRIGLIRVLTTTDPKLLASHGAFIRERFPDLEVVSRCIPAQPAGVYDKFTEEQAIPKVVALAREMEGEGLAAVIISCAGDPGFVEAREALNIPVIGAGRATALTALGLGKKIGTVGITAKAPLPMREILGQTLVAEERPVGVETTLDLLEPQGRQAVLQAVANLQKAGVEVVALACTGLSTIGMAGVIRRETGLFVVDPVTAAGLFAWYALLDGSLGGFTDDRNKN